MQATSGDVVIIAILVIRCRQNTRKTGNGIDKKSSSRKCQMCM